MTSLLKAGLITGLTLSFLIISSRIQLAQQAGQQLAPVAADGQQPARGGPHRGRVDPRVQQRTYTFPDTNEKLHYALFVSSKVTKDKKAPLIVALHGLGGDQDTDDGTMFAYVDRNPAIPPPKPNPWGCDDCFFPDLKVIRASDTSSPRNDSFA